MPEAGAALRHAVRGKQDELNVWPIERQIGADEPTRVEQIVGENSAPEQDVLQHVPGAPWERAPRNPVRNGGRAEMLDDHRKVVLQIAADAGQFVQDFDPVSTQLGPGADAGAHQDHRRCDRSAADDYFTPREKLSWGRADPQCHAGRAPAGKRDAVDLTVGDHRQVLARARRLEECGRGRNPASVEMSRLAPAEAFLLGAVEIPGQWHLH